MASAAAKQPIVLVVEDEFLILMAAIETFVEAGFEAIGALNADKAMLALESRDDVRVLFTDINMPGSMDGLGLAHAVKKRWPPIHLLITSALRIPDDRALPVGGRFFRKPYDPSFVTESIRELTAESPAIRKPPRRNFATYSVV
jgi:DNA-binding NtrC family response regulator